MALIVRKSQDRGHSHHGWLNTFHTFSFGFYFDSSFMNFSHLQVLNEDKVEPKHGFGTHSHSEMEIFSYVIEGKLRHKDFMGNVEVISRGDVQFTSAGTGIYHSEHNHSSRELVHFVQVWVNPRETRLKPTYDFKSFSDEEKKNKLLLILSGSSHDNKKVIHIHQDLEVYASILDSTSIKEPKLTFKTKNDKRVQYVHVCDRGTTQLCIEGTSEDFKKETVVLSPGDGCFISSTQTLTFVSLNSTNLQNHKKLNFVEFLLFDLPNIDNIN